MKYNLAPYSFNLGLRFTDWSGVVVSCFQLTLGGIAYADCTFENRQQIRAACADSVPVNIWNAFLAECASQCR